jgi:hypothetical protein
MKTIRFVSVMLAIASFTTYANELEATDNLSVEAEMMVRFQHSRDLW